MGILIALLILVSGLLVCLKDPVIYYKLHRYEGQLLYLQAARYGVYCFLIASIFLGIFSWSFSHVWADLCFCSEAIFCIPEFSTDFLAYLADKTEEAKIFEEGKGETGSFMLIVCVLMLFIPEFWSKCSLYFVRRRSGADNNDQAKAYILRDTVSHSPLGAALVEAFAKKLEVMISMDDRKVYVGYIKSVGKPNEIVGVDEEVEFLPSVSGYRDKNTLKVIYTTEYPSDTTIEPIYFKQENMVSVSFFSKDIRAAFEAEAASKASLYDLFWRKFPPKNPLIK